MLTRGRVCATSKPLLTLLALAVALLTVAVFFNLYAYGLFERSGSGGVSSWYFADRDAAGTAQIVASLSKNVESLQVRVGKAMEEIQKVLEEEPPQTLEEAVTRLRSDWKSHSNLLMDIAVSLDLVHPYLQQAAVSLLLKATPSEYVPPQHSAPLNGSRNNSTGVATVAEMATKDEKEEGEWAEDEGKESEPLVDFFRIEEIRKYIRAKDNRLGRKNFMGANATYASVGHACVSRKYELEQYMDYDVGEYCNDDWMLGQQLMVHGCDPLPRRRCFVRGPKFYQQPLPPNESLWAIPDDRNVRWDKYICKTFKCLGGPNRKGFFKCGECFNLEGHEKPKWMQLTNISTDADFLLDEVLSFKPGGLRIGLDFSVGVGTFAARMREHNITIASATLNLGAPFNEFIALRGLLPLYLSVNQRLPFFDNTLDIVHSTLFLDGWIDHQLLDFILFDWDRVLRPGGLLWIDRFFCQKEDLEDYLFYFKQLSYKRLKWVVVPKEDKDEGEMWFSAVLEKPPRPF